jgi:hypothetical protein
MTLHRRGPRTPRPSRPHTSAVATIAAPAAANTLRAAGDLCLTLAALDTPPGEPVVLDMADRYDYDLHEPGPRTLDVTELASLDRTVLRWMGTQFGYASRRVAGRGLVGADHRALAAAQALIDHGGRRPDAQAPIPVYPADAEDSVSHR